MLRIESKPVPFTIASIPYPRLAKIAVIGDGSCYFHAVLRAFNKTYINAETTKERKDYAMNLRYTLAASLEEKEDGVMYYDTLFGGTLRGFSQGFPHYSLESMKSELRSSRAVDNVYHQLVAEKLNKDIYLIDAAKGDLYMETSEPDKYYKNRDSIFILYNSGHYDVIGVLNSAGGVDTLLKHDHPFTLMVKARLEQKISILIP